MYDFDAEETAELRSTCRSRKKNQKSIFAGKETIDIKKMNIYTSQ